MADQPLPAPTPETKHFWDGTRSGELALRILNGTPPGDLPIEVRSNGTPMFDWRALRRWHIHEARLPANSVVRFRQPSQWEEHKWQIIGAAVIIAAQALALAGMFVQR